MDVFLAHTAVVGAKGAAGGSSCAAVPEPRCGYSGLPGFDEDRLSGFRAGACDPQGLDEMVDEHHAGPVWKKSMDGILPLASVSWSVMSEVTRILADIEQGDSKAAEQLIPLVYDELRKLAAAKLAHEKPGQTIQATALVHDAFLRLVDQHAPQQWENRRHFFAAAAEAMRHILVDSARRKRRAKHGGGQERLDLSEVEIAAGADDEKILLVNEALEKLAMEDPIRAEVVKLHYFVGLTHAESAEILQISEKTVRRHWNYARVWLFQTIQSADQPNAFHSGNQPDAPAE
jgi:RNA polymerase sigma factor (TIGR02999 family)